MVSNKDVLKRILYFRHIQPIVATQWDITGLNKELNTRLILGVLVRLSTRYYRIYWVAYYNAVLNETFKGPVKFVLHVKQLAKSYPLYIRRF